MPCDTLEAAGFSTKQAFEDADILIVEAAIENTNSEEATIIVLLVSSTQIAPLDRLFYFLKPGKEKVAEKIYCSKFCK